MAKEKLQITGTQNKTYDIDELQQENRTNAEKPLVVQVYKYKKGENPNPTNPQIGQIWLSKMITGDNK